MRYNNWRAIEAMGVLPIPKHGDVARWLSNGKEWSVDYDDDLNPVSSIIKPLWEDDVALVRRGSLTITTETI